MSSQPLVLPARIQRVLAGSALAALAVVTPGLTPAHAGTVTTTATIPSPPSGLVKTGTTIPKTNYPIPAGAIFMSSSAGKDTNAGTKAAPVKTINQAVKRAPENGTIVLRSGQYRDWYHDKAGTSFGYITKSLTLQAYPGEAPWFNGTDKIAASKWKKTSGQNVWSMPWSTPQFCNGQYYSRPLKSQSVSPNTGPCAHFDMSRDPSNPMAVDPQMIYVNNVAMKQVAKLSEVGAKTFFYDWTNRKMYMGVSPTNKKVELAARPTVGVMSSKGKNRVLGIGFRMYATNQYHNFTAQALTIAGGVSLVENNVFTLMAGAALGTSNPLPGSTLRHNVFASNGYTALGANGGSQKGTRNDYTMDSNVLWNNNTEKFGTDCSASCGQAAAKFAHMVGLTITNNLVENTQGEAGGLWCDLNCSDTKIIYNVLKNNKGHSIFYEVSNKGLIASNLVIGGQYGIAVASANTKVYNNTLVDNVQGINVYDDSRSPGVNGWTDVGPDTRNVDVVNNVVSGRGYSLLGSSRVNAPLPNTEAKDLFTKVDTNTFYQANGTSPVFVYWRDRAGVQTGYRSRTTFVAERGFDRGSDWLTGTTNPLFMSSSDFRVRPGTSAYQAAADLPADVATVLGVDRHDADRSRGAFAR